MKALLYTLTADGKRIHISHPLHPAVTLCRLPVNGDCYSNVAAIGRELPFCYACKAIDKGLDPLTGAPPSKPEPGAIRYEAHGG